MPMNKLPQAKRVQILSMLCEGMGMRATARVCDVSYNTVLKMQADAGAAAIEMHDELVRGVSAKRVQCDEIWAFCYAKQRNVATAKAAPIGAGDVWTWTAIDADSKLILAYFIGDRSKDSALRLMMSVRDRVTSRLQLTTDGHKPYAAAVEGVFRLDVDYAQLVKMYGESPEAARRYSPPICIGAKKMHMEGNPDPAHVSTSYVERSNLSMRMHMRRFTRLTNAFSKKFISHAHSVALYTVFYNFIRIHKTLRVTPAMQAGIAGRVFGFEDILARIDARQTPAKRSPYKKRAA